MKALSIKQPYAILIALGIKPIENRTWKTNYRGRIYIHASGQYAANDLEILMDYGRYKTMPYEQFKELNSGIWVKSAIIGEVDIIDCVQNHPSAWAEITDSFAVDIGAEKPPYNWVLANAVLYNEPILNVKGKLSLWEFNKELV